MKSKNRFFLAFIHILTKKLIKENIFKFLVIPNGHIKTENSILRIKNKKKYQIKN